jgi:hypothetical protein
MKPQSTIRPGLPSDVEARAILEQAHRIRSETIAGLARALWLRIARRPDAAPAGVGAGALPHARA